MKVSSSHVKSKKISMKWVSTTIVVTFCLSILFSFVSDTVLERASVAAAIVILLVIIFAGIIFDILGIAVAAASPVPFHSMAARKVYGATGALKLIKNAEKVSNICNDVVGDIASIVSGAAGAAIIGSIIKGSEDTGVYGLIVTALVAAITVGGKAMGKTFALSNCNNIVFYAALFLELFERCNPFRLQRKVEVNDKINKKLD